MPWCLLYGTILVLSNILSKNWNVEKHFDVDKNVLYVIPQVNIMFRDCYGVIFWKTTFFVSRACCSAEWLIFSVWCLLACMFLWRQRYLISNTATRGQAYKADFKYWQQRALFVLVSNSNTRWHFEQILTTVGTPCSCDTMLAGIPCFFIFFKMWVRSLLMYILEMA